MGDPNSRGIVVNRFDIIFKRFLKLWFENILEFAEFGSRIFYVSDPNNDSTSSITLETFANYRIVHSRISHSIHNNMTRFTEWNNVKRMLVTIPFVVMIFDGLFSTDATKKVGSARHSTRANGIKDTPANTLSMFMVFIVSGARSFTFVRYFPFVLSATMSVSTLIRDRIRSHCVLTFWTIPVSLVGFLKAYYTLIRATIGHRFVAVESGNIFYHFTFRTSFIGHTVL